MSRALAGAVIDSMDSMDPTNSREMIPSRRMRHRAIPWLSLAGWTGVAFVALFVLAAFAR